MSNRRVAFDIETRDPNDDRPVLMINGKVWGYITKLSIEPMEPNVWPGGRGSGMKSDISLLISDPVELGTRLHKLFADEVTMTIPMDASIADALLPIDYEPIERRIFAHMSNIDLLLNGHFRALDLGLAEMIRRPQLKALPHEPHRTYDWRQRLSRKRRRR